MPMKTSYVILAVAALAGAAWYFLRNKSGGVMATSGSPAAAPKTASGLTDSVGKYFGVPAAAGNMGGTSINLGLGGKSEGIWGQVISGASGILSKVVPELFKTKSATDASNDYYPKSTMNDYIDANTTFSPAVDAPDAPTSIDEYYNNDFSGDLEMMV
jgi:hypothetical protein